MVNKSCDSRIMANWRHSVVFSSWRMTLDLVEIGLDQAGIRHVRFDGKVNQKQRSKVLKDFKTDPTVKVFLLTLSCGAVGLVQPLTSNSCPDF